MKQRTLCLLLAGALALALASCGAGDAPPSEPPPTQTAETSPMPSSTEKNTPPPASPLPEEPSPSPEGPSAAELSLPERDYRPWQVGYLDFLTQLRADEFANESAYAVMSEAERKAETGSDLFLAILTEGSTFYSLYDVDKDGVPELFVKFGDYEAAYHTRCYTFRDGETVLLGEFPSGHSSLYTYPDKNAFLVLNGHMGYAALYEYRIEDGNLAEGETLFTEENVAVYTEPGKVVSGAEAVDSYRTSMFQVSSFDFDGSGQLPPSLATPLLLPVCNWYGGLPATGSDSERAREAILAVLEDNAPFTGVSADGYYGDTGRTDLAEFADCQYRDEGALPYALAGYFWQDLNRDGQEECLIQLTSTYEDGSWCNNAFLVLSEQDGEVYGYGLAIASLCCPYTDGTIRHNSICCALAFWKEQCYLYYPTASGLPNGNYASCDEAAQPAEWVEAGDGSN